MYSAPLLNNKLHDSYRRIVYNTHGTNDTVRQSRQATLLRRAPARPAVLRALQFTHRYRNSSAQLGTTDTLCLHPWQYLVWTLRLV